VVRGLSIPSICMRGMELFLVSGLRENGWKGGAVKKK